MISVPDASDVYRNIAAVEHIACEIADIQRFRNVGVVQSKCATDFLRLGFAMLSAVNTLHEILIELLTFAENRVHRFRVA